MGNDLARGFISFVYLTFSHNEAVIAYFAGALLSGVLAFARPSRYSLLLLFGFVLLMINFWYDKHVNEALYVQTTNAIIIDSSKHLATKTYLKLFIQQLLPVIFYAVGWGMIFLALVIGARKEITKKQ